MLLDDANGGKNEDTASEKLDGVGAEVAAQGFRARVGVQEPDSCFPSCGGGCTPVRPRKNAKSVDLDLSQAR